MIDEQIKAILKHHNQTGYYGGTMFRMRSEMIAEVRGLGEHGAPCLSGIDYLMSIPVIVDDELPRGAWTLADRATGKVHQRRYQCERCRTFRSAWEIFGVGFPTERTYCLNHIPRWVRLKMWIRGRFNE